MPLELDTRQRAMLQEMGVHVWLPDSGVAVLEQLAPSAQQARSIAQGSGTASPSRTPAQAAGTGVPTPLPAVPANAVRAPVSDAQAPVQSRSPMPASAPATGGQQERMAPLEGSAPDWTVLANTVRNCEACALCAGRNQTTLLPPADPVACDWMVVGDAPDEDEDRAGAPFAGPDGVLLANMLRALGLQRANPLPSDPASTLAAADTSRPAAQRAYISNVLKCRPGHGALPQAAELAQCAVHLQQEIALVQPKMILAMGRYANQVLLAASPQLAAQPLGKLRGTVHSYRGIPVVVTYPPKLLMRNNPDSAKAKAWAWADLCLAATTLET